MHVERESWNYKQIRQKINLSQIGWRVSTNCLLHWWLEMLLSELRTHGQLSPHLLNIVLEKVLAWTFREEKKLEKETYCHQYDNYLYNKYKKIIPLLWKWIQRVSTPYKLLPLARDTLPEECPYLSSPSS